MASPKKRFSKKKNAIKKKAWIKKAQKKAKIAFNWANFVINKLNK